MPDRQTRQGECPKCGEYLGLITLYADVVHSLKYDTEPFDCDCINCGAELKATMVPIPTFDVKVKDE